MLLTFLSADVPLTKTIVRDPDTGELAVSSYPMVGRFTSSTVDCPDLSTAYEALRTNAATGACLLKGQLTTQLRDESRAGKTVSTAVTDYLVLDLDFAGGFDSIDAFLAELDPALADVSYIFQHSTSAGIKGTAGLRGHVFIRLAEATPPPVIKAWLQLKNLTVGALRNQVTLAASHQALKWPLDVTTCQNDKLIYISPPILLGLTDPLAERFVLRTKRHELAAPSFAVSPQIVRDKTDELITQLRKDLGLKRRAAKYRLVNGEEILLNPDEAIVTGVREARGYVYLNLNGGDSWGYYFPKDKPDLLYNFKGEPLVRLQDIAPDFYKSLIQGNSDDEIIPVMFRDWATDTYYNGLYNKTSLELAIHITASKEKLKDFAANYDALLPDPIPDWQYVFDPTTLQIIDLDRGWANKFVPTPYLRDTETQCERIPATINRVIRSVCGNDPEATEHFLNWLAYIFQTRRKTKTAWIFHGTNGTGKGILLTHILAPLLGPRYVQEYTTANMDDNFNATLEECLIQWLDEFHLDDSKGETRLLNKIKNLITEDFVMIRAMRRNAVQRRLYNNLIIATNHEDPYPLDERDRRFNVAPAQPVPIGIEQHDLDAIAEELKFFAAYLRDFTVDERRAQRILINEARRTMIAAAENSVDRFFRSLAQGDLDFFFQFLRERPPLTPDNAYIDYERAMRRWAAALNRPIAVSRDEASAVYGYLQNTKVSPNKFTSMCKRHKIVIAPHRMNGKIERGFLVTWRTQAPELIAEFLNTNNVVSLANAG